MRLSVPYTVLHRVFAAGDRSQALKPDDDRGRWGHAERDIESRFLSLDQMKLMQRCAREENRTKSVRILLRNLDALVTLLDSDGAKVKSLEVLPEAVRRYMKGVPHHYIFVERKDEKTLEPYMVVSATYHKAEKGLLPAGLRDHRREGVLARRASRHHHRRRQR
jgi:hypothetical protein